MISELAPRLSQLRPRAIYQRIQTARWRAEERKEALQSMIRGVNTLTDAMTSSLKWPDVIIQSIDDAPIHFRFSLGTTQLDEGVIDNRVSFIEVRNNFSQGTDTLRIKATTVDRLRPFKKHNRRHPWKMVKEQKYEAGFTTTYNDEYATKVPWCMFGIRRQIKRLLKEVESFDRTPEENFYAHPDMMGRQEVKALPPEELGLNEGNILGQVFGSVDARGKGLIEESSLPNWLKPESA